MRRRLPLLPILAALALVAMLGNPSPAHANNIRQSRHSNLHQSLVAGGHTYDAYLTVWWSDTSNHRISIDAVELTAHFVDGTRVAFDWPTGVQVGNVHCCASNSGTYHANVVPQGYTGTAASFSWPQQWWTTGSAYDATWVIVQTFHGSQLTTAKTWYFWN
jgi:hypothetical protein